MSLALFRSTVADWLRDQFDEIGHQPLTVYEWPTLKPETPAMVLIPGAPRGILVDFDAQHTSFLEPGFPEARIMVLLDAQWNAQAFAELDEIAEFMVDARPPFHVDRILQPGIVDDIPNRTLIGLGIDITALTIL